MNNTILFLLAALGVVSDLIEFTYDMGVATRKYGVPAAVAVYVAGEKTYTWAIQQWVKVSPFSYEMTLTEVVV